MGQQKDNSQIAFMGDRSAFVADVVREIREMLPALVRIEPAMDKEQAAAFLGCSVRHLETLVASNQIPFFDIAAPGSKTRQLRFWKDELRAWQGV